MQREETSDSVPPAEPLALIVGQQLRQQPVVREAAQLEQKPLARRLVCLAQPFSLTCKEILLKGYCKYVLINLI